MKIGSQVLLRQGLKLVRGVVIDIDLTFITLRLDYKKGQNCDIRIEKTSRDILKVDGININGFEYKDDTFRI